MTTIQLGIFAILAYAVAFVLQVAYSRQFGWRFFLVMVTVSALVLHAWQLHVLIDLPEGQNLSGLNLFSLVTWLSALLVLIADRFFEVRSLNFFIYPLAISAISLQAFCHRTFLVVTQHHPFMLIHVLFATLVVALFMIGGIQALLLLFQQYILKRKKHLNVLVLLPSLDTMERLLFVEMSLNFLMLSVFLLIAGLVLPWHQSQIYGYEAILCFLVWIVFLALLTGRYFLRWRSANAAVVASVVVPILLLLYLSAHHRIAYVIF